MTFEEWYEKYDNNIDIANLIYHLQKVKPYTDEEIIDAIEKIKATVNITRGLGSSISIRDIVNLIVVNETYELK